MKIFSAIKNKTLDRETALALAGINQFATPGLGTILAGKFLAGVMQLAFAVGGFALLMFWFYSLFQAMLSGGEAGPSSEWELGLALFAVGWILSLITSLKLIRNAQTKKPPKLDGTVG